MIETRYGGSRRREMLQFIPPGARRVLDIGCHTGNFGAALREERACEVWGVEPDRAAAAAASEVLDRVIAEPYSAALDIPERSFDVVVFNDVLEHLIDPWQVLRTVRRHLAPEGEIVVSLPNLLHQSNLRHMLFERDFRYEQTGIRDSTHLRFFTAKSARRMLEETGYEVGLVQWINESWYPPGLPGRIAYRVFARALHETKFIQIALRARPRGS